MELKESKPKESKSGKWKGREGERIVVRGSWRLLTWEIERTNPLAKSPLHYPEVSENLSQKKIKGAIH